MLQNTFCQRHTNTLPFSPPFQAQAYPKNPKTSMNGNINIRHLEKKEFYTSKSPILLQPNKNRERSSPSFPWGCTAASMPLKVLPKLCPIPLRMAFQRRSSCTTTVVGIPEDVKTEPKGTGMMMAERLEGAGTMS